MIVASKKRKENIAEYLLYMWQIEDLIRANGLDIDKIRTNIIDKFNLDETQRREMTEWYESLIDMMRREGEQEYPQSACAAASGVAERSCVSGVYGRILPRPTLYRGVARKGR